MTIWILAVLLLASTAGLGLRQGAIRVAFSFVGIVLGALLALPLGNLVRLGLSKAHLVQEPVVLWMLPPAIAFVIVWGIFKIAAQFVHKKVEVYYKYKAGDLRLALWDRLNHRLGLCLGPLNGASYLVLISFAIYIFSYWTVQVAGASSEPKGLRLLNRLGWDLQETGMSKVARSLDRMPQSYYETADLVGEIYHTPLSEARLYRYPAFLSLAEKPAFHDLYTDSKFADLWQSQKPITDLLNYPKVQTIVNNPGQLETIWNIVEPNLQDLQTFLKTGRSPQYASQKILGRWDFDVNAALAAIRSSKPHISYMEMKRVKAYLATYFPKTQLVAAPDKKAFLKQLPHVQVNGKNVSIKMLNAEGHWKQTGAKYEFTFSISGKSQTLTGEIQRGRLTFSAYNPPLVFQRED